MIQCLSYDVVYKVRGRAFFLLTVSLILCLGTISLGAQKGKEHVVYYENITIHSGDTLWEIAKKYKSEGEKIEHMICEIMELNGMCSENIMSGESLIVPVKR